MSGQKILAILSDDLNHQSSIEFAFELFGNSNSLVIASFLSDKSANLSQRRAISSELQKDFGQRKGIKLIVRPENGLKSSELQKEVRYTDLIVYPLKNSTSEPINGLPAPFIKLLSQTKVPIILVPNNLMAINEVFLTCDGKPDSIKSIKQFCQIMGDFCKNIKVTLLEFNHDPLQFQPNEEKLLIEYLKQHCDNLGIYKVSEEAPEKILQLVNYNKNAMIVSSTIQFIGKSLLTLPAFTNRLVTVENSPGFFGGY